MCASIGLLTVRLDGLTPNAANGRTPRSAGSVKRKSDFVSPSLSKVTKVEYTKSPMETPSKHMNGGGTDGLRYVVRAAT